MRTVLLALALAVPMAAQSQPKIFELKYGDVQRIGDMLRVFPQEGLMWDTSMRTITARGTPEQLKAIEEAIKRFDVATASQNIEFTIYLVVGSADAGKGGPVPAALDPVVKQMSQSFSFKSFRLAETLMLRTRDGRPSEVSSLGPQRGPHYLIYQAKFKSARIIPDEKGKNVRVDDLRVGMRLPYMVSGGNEPKYQFADIGFNTDIDVREGQKAVVGKANIDGTDTMFAVIVPRIVD